MTNDTAMTKQESEVMIEQLKKVFEVVRLLDVDTLEMGNLKGVEDVDGFPCKCYDFWKKGTRCKNCTSKEALQKKEIKEDLKEKTEKRKSTEAGISEFQYLPGNFQIYRNRR